MTVLYEYRCFIKLNSMLRESGYKLDSQDFVKVTRDGFAVSLVKGETSCIRCITDKGEKIELFYRYDGGNKQNNIGGSQVATTQKPDNVLSLTNSSFEMKSGTSNENDYWYQYAFVAKYRIGADADYMCRGTTAWRDRRKRISRRLTSIEIPSSMT